MLNSPIRLIQDTSTQEFIFFAEGWLFLEFEK